MQIQRSIGSVLQLQFAPKLQKICITFPIMFLRFSTSLPAFSFFSSNVPSTLSFLGFSRLYVLIIVILEQLEYPMGCLKNKTKGPNLNPYIELNLTKQFRVLLRSKTKTLNQSKPSTRLYFPYKENYHHKDVLIEGTWVSAGLV